jgi:hypothetical protein
MNPVIVEKDFWVYLILKRLFLELRLEGQMVCKGERAFPRSMA